MIQEHVRSVGRLDLHGMGGLPVLRWRNQNSFGIPMFHSFSEADRPNVEALCSHIAHYFEPVTLSAIVEALNFRKIQ